MRRFILDTSVILKWFSEFDENDLGPALQLRSAMQEGNVFFIVPDLLFYELANALRHNPNFSTSDVKQAVHSVWEMGLEGAGPNRYCDLHHRSILGGSGRRSGARKLW